jgi:FkbM family methyltransferase
MKRVLRWRSSAVDVGAHRGAILQHIVRLAPAGVHYAFEPLPHLGTYLQVEFPEVNVHQAAVADRVGSAEFLHVENDPGYSGLRRRNYDRPDPIISRIEVVTTTIDEVIPQDHPVDFIKIDIEGGEFHALKGALKTISRCRPVIVFEASCHSTGKYDVTPADLFALVTGTLNYELSTMDRWLDRRHAFSFEEFERNWQFGPDYYFIAAPRKG